LSSACFACYAANFKFDRNCGGRFGSVFFNDFFSFRTGCVEKKSKKLNYFFKKYDFF